MPVSGVDHVNILTDALEATASFYEQVLGLTRSENPTISKGTAGYWMRDASGSAIVHIVDRTTAGNRYDAYRPGQPTNALHHFALRCTGFAETVAKIEELGLAHRVAEHPAMGLRQVFLIDPNAVNLELNFAGA